MRGRYSSFQAVASGTLKYVPVAGLALVLILVTWLLASRAVSGSDEPGLSGIKFRNGLLSVDLKDKPLFEILQGLSRIMDVKIETVALKDRPITVTFSEEPLEKGLKRLLSNQNTVFVYLDQDKKTEQVRLVKIIIFGSDANTASREIGGDKPPSEQQTEKAEQHSLDLADHEDLDTGRVINNEKAGAPSLQELVSNLQNQDPDLREDALYDIASDHEAEALPYLEKSLTQDENSMVRVSAAELLGEIDSEASISALAKGLQDADVNVRRAVIDALGIIGGAKVLPALNTALQEKNSELREEVEDLIKEIEEGEDGSE